MYAYLCTIMHHYAYLCIIMHVHAPLCIVMYLYARSCTMILFFAPLCMCIRRSLIGNSYLSMICRLWLCWFSMSHHTFSSQCLCLTSISFAEMVVISCRLFLSALTAQLLYHKEGKTFFLFESRLPFDCKPHCTFMHDHVPLCIKEMALKCFVQRDARNLNSSKDIAIVLTTRGQMEEETPVGAAVGILCFHSL